MVTPQPSPPQVSASKPILGIDFGTSKSVVAICQGENPVIIPDPQGRKSIPSLVMVGQDERIHTGWDALNHPDRYHSKQFTINSIKRQIGKAGESSWGGYKTYPHEIAALILGQLKLQAEAYLDQEISQAVIAIPANFDINQRWAILQAAEIAGLQAVRLLNEATAAVLAARHSLKQDLTVLVFDFGAGTLDVSIIACGDDVFEVRATAGDDRLGGDDFDQLLYDHLLEQAKMSIGASLELTPVEQLVLRDAAQRAKIELSQALSTQVFIPGFVRTPSQAYDLSVSLTRTAFESLCRPLFERTERVIKRALADADIQSTQPLNQVFMIGGTSKIPRLHNLVQSLTNRKPSTLIDSELGVAQGASIFAGVLGGTISNILLLTALPSTLSVATQGDVTAPIIPRNTTIPTRQWLTFSTSHDNMPEIPIKVVQGENPLASQNTLVGTITLTGVPPAPKGVPQIEVTFDVDVNEDLQVSATDKATGRSVQAVMQSPYRLNNAQLKVLKRKVTKEMEDKRQKAVPRYEQQRLELARKETLAFMHHLDQLLNTAGQDLSPKFVSMLSSGRSLLQNYLDWFVPADKLHYLQVSIRETCYEAISASLVAEWVTISQLPEFIQWAHTAASTWQNPVDLDESLHQFGSRFNPSIARTVEITWLPLFMREDVLVNKMLEQVKHSTSAYLLLAIVLGLFGDRDVSLPGVDTSQPEQQILHMIFLLGTLRKGSPEARRKAAKRLFFLPQTTNFTFISEYLRSEVDAETITWLEKYLSAIPAEIWLTHYQNLSPEEKTRLVSNNIIRQKIYQGAFSAFTQPSPQNQLASLQSLEELGIQDTIPQAIGLLSPENDPSVTTKLVDLLTATRDPRVVTPILGLLGQNSRLNRFFLERLAACREVMTVEMNRFYDLACKVVLHDQSISLKERIFLTKFSNKFPELETAIKYISGKKS